MSVADAHVRSLAALFPGVPERERPQADVDEPDAGDDSQVVVATVRILEGQLFLRPGGVSPDSGCRQMEPKAERMPSDGRMGPRDEVFTAEAWSRREPVCCRYMLCAAR